MWDSQEMLAHMETVHKEKDGQFDLIGTKEGVLQVNNS